LNKILGNKLESFQISRKFQIWNKLLIELKNRFKFLTQMGYNFILRRLPHWFLHFRSWHHNHLYAFIGQHENPSNRYRRFGCRGIL